MTREEKVILFSDVWNDLDEGSKENIIKAIDGNINDLQNSRCVMLRQWGNFRTDPSKEKFAEVINRTINILDSMFEFYPYICEDENAKIEFLYYNKTCVNCGRDKFVQVSTKNISAKHKSMQLELGKRISTPCTSCGSNLFEVIASIDIVV